jgi:hypothetical protein
LSAYINDILQCIPMKLDGKTIIPCQRRSCHYG